MRELFPCHLELTGLTEPTDFCSCGWSTSEHPKWKHRDKWLARRRTYILARVHAPERITREVLFTVTPDARHMIADPAGAMIRCTLDDQDNSRILIATSAGEHIADVTLRVPDGADITLETREVAVLLYRGWYAQRWGGIINVETQL